jgi:hypothetical protein
MNFAGRTSTIAQICRRSHLTLSIPASRLNTTDDFATYFAMSTCRFTPASGGFRHLLEAGRF